MKVVLISDTHNLHEHLKVLPEGDLLIHAGDFTNNGKPEDVHRFVEWFDRQCSKFKFGGILIAGNHDISLDITRTSPTNLRLSARAVRTGKHFRYLQDEAYILPNGLKVYGSPWSPWFHGNLWAFNKFEEQIVPVWDRIPGDVSILVTHTPPWGISDTLPGCGHIGCTRLRRKIDSLGKLSLHVFGHIHPGYGVHTDPRDPRGIVFVNASVTSIVSNVKGGSEYVMSQEPITIDL